MATTVKAEYEPRELFDNDYRPQRCVLQIRHGDGWVTPRHCRFVNPANARRDRAEWWSDCVTRIIYNGRPMILSRKERRIIRRGRRVPQERGQ